MMIYRAYFPWLFLSIMLIFVGCSASGPSVYVDNYSGRNIALEVDGKAWIEVPTNISLKRSIPAGPHSLVLYDVKNRMKLDKMEIEVIAGKKHVLNLLAGATYQSDASIVAPKAGDFDVDKLLAGGQQINDKFFIADQDYVLDEIPRNFTGLSQTEAGRKTYLRRIPIEELKSYSITENDYWRRDVNGKKMEVLSPENKDKIYDIIRQDKVCESLEELGTLLENPIPMLNEKCPGSIEQQEGQTLEKWFVEKNRLIQLILRTITTGQLAPEDQKKLDTYKEQNDFAGFFDALEEIDPQVNDLAAFQARYHRLQEVKSMPGIKKQHLQVMENRLRHAMGFKTNPLR